MNFFVTHLQRLVLVIGMLTGCVAYGQQYHMLHYTVNDGLPTNLVYTVYRDSKGFMWIGTDKGIARYNGIKFEVFSTLGGAPDNEVLFFQEDKLGRLWLGTYNGQLCYYKNDTFHTAANTPFLRGIKGGSGFIRTILPQSDSSVNFDYSEDVLLVNVKGNHCKVVAVDRSYSTLWSVSHLIYNSKLSPNKYIVATSKEIYTVDSNGRVLNRQYTNHKNQVREFFSQNQEQTHHINQGIVTVYAFGDTIVRQDKYGARAVYYDGKRLFVATLSGKLFVDDEQLPITGYVSAITQDVRGNYWITTTGNGIYILSKNFRDTRVIQNAYKGVVKLCRTVDSNVYFATSEQMYALRNGLPTSVFIYKHDFRESVRDTQLTPIFFLDEQGIFYFFNSYRLNIKSVDRVKKVNKIVISDCANAGKFIAHVGGCTFMTTHGAISFLKDDQQKERGTSDFQSIGWQRERMFYAKGRSYDSSFLVSTLSGIYKISQKGYRVRISNIALKCFEFCGPYMIGYTHNNELVVLTDQNQQLVADTLKSNDCIWHQFHPINDTQLLISTNGQYRMFTIRSNTGPAKYSLVTIENEFLPLYADAICADTNNFYFFKDTSIVSLRVQDVLSPSPPAKIFWTRITAGKINKTIGDTVFVPYDESGNIKIRFSVLSFSGKNVNAEYSVSKNGKDNWQRITGEEINLVHPGWGIYKVKIRTRNYTGEYSKPQFFLLEIGRPFWAATWFLIVVCFFVLLLMLVAVAVTRRSVMVLAKKRQQHMELELKSVYAQLNPHFIFNSLNAAMYLVQSQKFEAAYQHIHKFSMLLRSYISSSRNRFILLDDEINNLKNYIELQQERFNNKFTYQITSDVGDADVYIPSLLIQPLVENAITHGLRNKTSAGHLSILFTAKMGGDMLECIVEDNGIGRAESALVNEKNAENRKSYGSDLVTELVNALNKGNEVKITIEYTDKRLPLTGTIVKLTILKLKK